MQQNCSTVSVMLMAWKTAKREHEVVWSESKSWEGVGRVSEVDSSSARCRADALELRETERGGAREGGREGDRQQWPDGALFVLESSSVAVLLTVEALYAAQGHEDPAAASGSCPIWICGPAEAGGPHFPCCDSQPLYADTMGSYRTLKRM
ncbi:hypothetical protein INR49_014416 [Caranx melampygus]|nr:hypothetical protein INR49_014416 [Caranx melampygus]